MHAVRQYPEISTDCSQTHKSPLYSGFCWKIVDPTKRTSVPIPNPEPAAPFGAGAQTALLGARTILVHRRKEAAMAAFVGKSWGRYVHVKGYRRRARKGRARIIRPYLRKWPGTKAALYFSY